MKKRAYMILAALAAVTVLSGCSYKTEASQSETTTAAAQTTAAVATTDTQAGTVKHHVNITVKNYGSISVELDAEHAPITVENFMKLAKDGFYNGLTFHRIISDFMIQGGDPQGTGLGGSDTTIKGEFSSNGVENPLSHTRGAISMARSQQMDSASSQFFIVHKDSVFLDGDYAAFGYVTEGMDIVDKICGDVKVTDSDGTVLAENQPIIESIEVID